MAGSKIRAARFNASTSALILNGAPCNIHGYSFRETGGSATGTVQLLTQPPPTGGQGYAAATSSSATVEVGGETVDIAGHASPPAYPTEGVFHMGGIYVKFTGTGVLTGTVWYS